MDKAALRLFQNLGTSGGSRKNLRERTSHHYCAPSSVQFTVEGSTISHSPVYVSRRKQRGTWTEAPARFSSSVYPDRLLFCFRTSYLPSLITTTWSDIWNSSQPLNAVTRCPKLLHIKLLLDPLLQVYMCSWMRSFLDAPLIRLIGECWILLPLASIYGE